jgi:signal transduction histidine kinase
MARLGFAGQPVRLRFTALYAGLFLLSGAGLLALTFLLSQGGTRVAPGQSTGGQPGQSTGGPPGTAGQIRQLQEQLAQVHAIQTRQLLVGSLLALVVMTVVSVLLGHAVAWRVLRPLRLITAATRRISAASLHRRLAVPGPADEVKDLADTIDGLLARLEASFAAQRRFVADASHELRTPLATMRASLDVAVAKPAPEPQALALAGRLRTELDRVDGLLEGLLVLARAEHGALGERTPVPLDDLVSEALTAQREAIRAKALTVDLDAAGNGGAQPGAAPVWGNRTLLARLVGNLVDNAIVHNDPDGWIRITAGGPGPEVSLVVETGGAVLDPAHVARLAEPFRRVAADRTGSDSGSGLGLSIVAAVAAAHGGRLDLHARPAGGLHATVTLPAAAPEPAAVGPAALGGEAR